MQTKDALFSFHKKVVGNTLHIYNDHIYSLLHALSDESSEEGGGGRESIVWYSLRAWVCTGLSESVKKEIFVTKFFLQMMLYEALKINAKWSNNKI